MENQTVNLNDLRDRVHAANAKWWQNVDTGKPLKRNKGELLALIHSEISEALEGERKSKSVLCPHCKSDRTVHIGLELESGHIWKCLVCQKEHIGPQPIHVFLMDDKLPHRKMAEVELVDALIRILDYAGGFGYDLQGAFEEKMAYNAKREDHTHEARRAAGGKQF